LYIPLWKTVERFGPDDNDEALDEALTKKFAKQGINYIRVAELCPAQAQKQMCGMFLMFYMHARLMDAHRALVETPADQALAYPSQFQRALAGKLNGDTLTRYVQDYAERLQASPEVIQRWVGYNDALPFWSNVVQYLRGLAAGTRMELGPELESPRERQGWLAWMSQFLENVTQTAEREGLWGPYHSPMSEREKASAKRRMHIMADVIQF